MAEGRELLITLTYVKADSALLKVWAQTDAAKSALVDDSIALIEPALENGEGLPHPVELKVNRMCCAKFVEDGKWYRARITSLSSVLINKIVVKFMDYGNYETVALTDIREVDDSLFSIPALATEFVLADVGPSTGSSWSQEAVDYVTENWCYEDAVAIVAGSEGQVSKIHLFSPKLANTSLAKCLIDKGYAKPATETRGMATYTDLDLRVGANYTVYVSHAASLAQFWIQLSDNETALNDLMSEIETFSVHSSDSLQRLSLESPCIASFSEDEAFYRAKVMGISDPMCQVQFVDYGNNEMKKLTDLKPIPEHLLTLPAQAVECSLHASQSTPNNSQLVKTFVDLTEGKQLLCTVMSRPSKGKYVVELRGESGNLVELLKPLPSPTLAPAPALPLKYARECLIPLKPYEVKMAHIESVSEFYCHVDGTVVLLEDLMHKLAQFMAKGGQPMNTNDCSPGSPCCIKYSEDNQWYRAEIQAVLGGGGQVKVQYVDYGNTEVLPCDRLRQIPTNFVQVAPAQAVGCCLTNHRELGGVTVEPFEELVYDKTLAMKVARVVNNVAQVDLFDMNANPFVCINEALKTGGTPAPAPRVQQQQSRLGIAKPALNRTEEICIVVVDTSSGQFFGQLSKYPMDQLDDFQINLNEFYSTLKRHELDLYNSDSTQSHVGDYCCAQFTEDEQFYRGLVETEDKSARTAKVFFVDYGNSETKTFDDVKQLKPEFASMPQQGITCLLSDYPSLSGNVLNNVLSDNTIEVAIPDPNAKVCRVSLTGSRLNKVILDKLQTLAAKTTMTMPAEVKPTAQQQTPIVTPYSKPPLIADESVIVTHVVNPNHIWCQLQRSAEVLLALMEEIENYCVALPPMEGSISTSDVVQGRPCLAKYAVDENWYRAVIREYKGGPQASVLFVDFGNSEVTDLSMIKTIPRNFMTLPRQCIECTLYGVVQQPSWSPQVVEELEVAILEQKLTAVFKGDPRLMTEPYPVDLTKGGNNVIHTMKTPLPQIVASPMAKAAPAAVAVADSGWEDDPEPPVATQPSYGGSRFQPNSHSKGDGWSNQGNQRFGKTQFNMKSGAGGGGGFRGKESGDTGSNDWQESKGGFDGGRKGFAGGGFQDRSSFGNRSGGFGKRDDSAEDRGGSFGGNRSQGGFGRRDDNSQDRGSFGGRPQGGGFGKRDDSSEGSFGSSRSQGGFGRRDDNSSFGNRGGFTKRDEGFEDRAGGNRGGFGKRDDSSEDRGGSFGSRSQNFSRSDSTQERGSFGSRPQSGGFGGGFSKRDDSQQESFGNRSSSSGFGNNRSQGGFGRKDENSSSQDRGGGGFGSRGSSSRKDSEGDSDVFAKPARSAFGSSGSNKGFGRKESESSVDETKPSRAFGSPSVIDSVSINKDGCFYSVDVENGQFKDIAVVHIVSPSEFYCHLVEQSGKLQTLMDSIANMYDSLGEADLKLNSLRTDMACCAKFSEDHTWYRAKVTALHGSNVEVLFVDYGNTEIVPVSAVKELKVEFLSLPCQALKCALENTKPTGDSWTHEDVEKFRALTEEECLVAQVVNHLPSGAISLNLINPGLLSEINISRELVTSGHGKVVSQLLRGQSLHHGRTTYIAPIIENGAKEDILTSWVLNPYEFYCNLVAAKPQLDTMMNNIQQAFKSEAFTAMTNWKANSPCMARFSDDNVWYRGSIQKLEGDKVSVFYVDFGNSEVISRSRVRAIVPEFMALPMQAVKCRLRGAKPVGDTWGTQENFEKYFGTQGACTFHASYKNCYLVDVEVNGVDIAQEMIKDGIALVNSRPSSCMSGESVERASSRASEILTPYPVIDLEWSTGEYKDIVWCGKGTPEKFWCNLVSGNDGRVSLSAQLEEMYGNLQPNELKLSNPSKGTPCVVKVADDKWMRAMIETRLSPSKLVVFLVDTGCSEEVTILKCKQIKDEFLQLPGETFCCSLQGIPKAADMSKFLELFAADYRGADLVAQLVRKVDLAYDVHLFQLVDGEEKNVLTALLEKYGPIEELPPVVEPVCVKAKALICGTEESKVRKAAGDGGVVPEVESLIVEPDTLSIADLADTGSIFSDPRTVKHPFACLTNRPHGKVEGQVMHIMSPSLFWVMRTSDEAASEDLAAALQEKYGAGDNTELLLPLAEATPGVACVAKYADDEQWYRGTVLSVEMGVAYIHFVDYGNSDSVPLSSVCRVSEEFMNIPPMTLRCELFGVTSTEDDWTSEAIEEFETLTCEKRLVVHVVAHEGQMYSVRLLDMGLDVATSLIEKGFTTPIPAYTKYLSTNLLDVSAVTVDSTTSNGEINTLPQVDDDGEDINALDMSVLSPQTPFSFVLDPSEVSEIEALSANYDDEEEENDDDDDDELPHVEDNSEEIASDIVSTADVAVLLGSADGSTQRTSTADSKSSELDESGVGNKFDESGAAFADISSSFDGEKNVAVEESFIQDTSSFEFLSPSRLTVYDSLKQDEESTDHVISTLLEEQEETTESEKPNDHDVILKGEAADTSLDDILSTTEDTGLSDGGDDDSVQFLEPEDLIRESNAMIKAVQERDVIDLAKVDVSSEDVFNTAGFLNMTDLSDVGESSVQILGPADPITESSAITEPIEDCSLGHVLKGDPSLDDMLRGDSNLDDVLKGDPNLDDVLKRGPNLGDVLKRDPNLDDMFKEDPNLDDVLQEDPKLDDVLKGEPNLDDVLKGDPSSEDISSATLETGSSDDIPPFVQEATGESNIVDTTTCTAEPVQLTFLPDAGVECALNGALSQALRMSAGGNHNQFASSASLRNAVDDRILAGHVLHGSFVEESGSSQTGTSEQNDDAESSSMSETDNSETATNAKPGEGETGLSPRGLPQDSAACAAAKCKLPLQPDVEYVIPPPKPHDEKIVPGNVSYISAEETVED